MNDENVTQETEEAGNSRRKLAKNIVDETQIVEIEVLGGEKGKMEFDYRELPENIQEKLPAFAVNHKLGDAAAGRSGTEAEEAITKVWEGMMAGQFGVRAPAQPKVTKKAIVDQLGQMDDEEAATARALLEKLGFKL
jgi:hypothetical protein